MWRGCRFVCPGPSRAASQPWPASRWPGPCPHGVVDMVTKLWATMIWQLKYMGTNNDSKYAVSVCNMLCVTIYTYMCVYMHLCVHLYGYSRNTNSDKSLSQGRGLQGFPVVIWTCGTHSMYASYIHVAYDGQETHDASTWGIQSNALIGICRPHGVWQSVTWCVIMLESSCVMTT